MKRGILTAAAVMMAGSATTAVAAEPPNAKLRAVPLTQVQVHDAFWGPRIETNRASTLPHNLAMCEETGRLSNFAKAAKRVDGEFEGIYFNDSDVYKVMEGAAHVLATKRDAELEARIDALIDDIAGAQQPDGYLNTYYTLAEPDKRWTNLDRMHELYCAGHMFEAAVAYAQATGKTKFLDVAIRKADLIDSIFGFDKRVGTPGHEEIELALLKLWQQTGNDRYRALAEFFVAARGKGEGDNGMYRQAHKPVKEQREIAGHAVRALYLFCGVADVAALTGDPEYLTALDAIWTDVAERKLYVTGGVGARHEGEAFGGAYELPNDSAYAETCAGIALALWAQRLGLMTADARHYDVVERTLYNAFLSSVSLDGKKFFYVNPLASHGQHHRKEWYNCACCPTNIVRVMPQVPGFAYAQTDDAVYVNLYIGGTASIALASGDVTLTQETRYPWDGKVRIAVEPAAPAEFAIHLRIPDWCDGATVAVNGTKLGGVTNLTRDNGYLALTRRWKSGDVIDLDLPMPVRRIQAHPSVTANHGRIALQRGPIVYCLEREDNRDRLTRLVLPRDAELRTEWQPDLLGGVTVIKAKGLAVDPPDWTGQLYRTAGGEKTAPADITAIPYCVWDNRDPGDMTVWIPEITSIAQ